MQSPDVLTSSTAAQMLASLGDLRGIDFLNQQLDAENPEKRLQAAGRLLSLLGPQTTNTADLGDAFAYGRQLAPETTLQRVGLLREQVFSSLPDYPWELVMPSLQLELEKSQEQIEASGRGFGPDKPRMASTLSELLSSSDPIICITAAQMLNTLDDPRGKEGFVTLLQAADPRIRFEAACQLAIMGEDRSAAVLAELVETDDVQLRDAAIQVLGQLQGTHFRETMLKLLNSKNLDVRLAVALELASQRRTVGVKALLSALDSEDPHVLDLFRPYIVQEQKTEAEDSLSGSLNRGFGDIFEEFFGGIGAPSPQHDLLGWVARQTDDRAVSCLVRLVRAQDAWIRLSAARQLTAKDNTQGLDAMAELLSEGDPTIRLEAAKTLAGRGNVRAFQTLRQLLSAENVQTRIGAASALLSSKVFPIIEDSCESIAGMLCDTDQVEHAPGVTGSARCVADVAYAFLKRNLTHTGQIVIEKS